MHGQTTNDFRPPPIQSMDDDSNVYRNKPPLAMMIDQQQQQQQSHHPTLPASSSLSTEAFTNPGCTIIITIHTIPDTITSITMTTAIYLT